MTNLTDGSIISIDQIKNDTFNYKGKQVKFEQDKDNSSLYTARVPLTKEEKEAGNLEEVITFIVEQPSTGTINTGRLPPETKEFKNLTDAEKMTKLNSVAFQHGGVEPTDRGANLDTILQSSYTTQQPQSQEELKQVLKLKQKEESEQNYQEDSRQQANKELGQSSGATTTGNNTSKKSGKD